MAEIAPFRIFLASPGDVPDERAIVSACVSEFNNRAREASSASFEVVGWDRVRGTARRPQEAINELIGESHFTIVLFKSSWGSEPGSRWGYTSGTEEELFTGLLDLAEPTRPMRDVWIAFIDGPTPDQRILSLKQQIVDNHAALFESISGVRDLKTKLTERLTSWASSATKKTPRFVDLLPSSGKDVLRAAHRRLRGEQLIALGQAEAGGSRLREAAAIGGPLEQLALAQFLRRRGDLAGAYDHTQIAISTHAEEDTLHTWQAADAFSAQARVLDAQGRHHDAIGRLQHALELLVSTGHSTTSVRSRILDDLGLAHRKIGDSGSARTYFQQSLQLRREAGLISEVPQSSINLARLEVAEDRLAAAREHAECALADLQNTPPSSVHANAGVLIAQVSLRQGKASEGLTPVERALSINRQIGNRQGEAICLLVLGQCYRAVGRIEDAKSHFQDCLTLNISIQDESGASKAQWQLDNLH